MLISLLPALLHFGPACNIACPRFGAPLALGSRRQHCLAWSQPASAHAGPRCGAPLALAGREKQGLGWSEPASALAAVKLAKSQDRLFDRLVLDFGGVADSYALALGGGSSGEVKSFEAAESGVAHCAALSLRTSSSGTSLTEISCWCAPPTFRRMVLVAPPPSPGTDHPKHGLLP
jgi:hypothetical protein